MDFFLLVDWQENPENPYLRAKVSGLNYARYYLNVNIFLG